MNKRLILWLVAVMQLTLLSSLFAQEITFSHDRGFYDQAFELALSAPVTYNQLYYTTDCSTPTTENGTLYSGTISITKTTVVRVGAYSATDTLETSLTYIFLDDVIQQDRPGNLYPDYWADGIPSHYTLTSDITENILYKNRIKPALLSLPTISVSTEVGNLFGTNGIYTNSLETGFDWERRAAVEFIFPESGASFATFSGLRIHGGASRIPKKSPKHSFKLYFRSEYGDKKLNYPLFDQTNNNKFDELVLRAGYNNSWVHFSEQQRTSAQYIRDEWVRRSYKAMGNASVIGDFFHLYVNGLYWGVYNITEKLSSDFMEEYLSGDKETWNVINSGVATDGEEILWTDLMSQLETAASAEALYEHLKTKLDINNFIDYMLLNYFTGMEDWGVKNWYVACNNADGAKFHFFCWDSERSMEDVNHNILGIEFENSPVTIFNKIRSVDEFAQLFGDRVYKHLFNDGVLTVENNQKRWEELSDRVKEALVAESARWGNYRKEVHPFNNTTAYLYTVDEYWVKENNRIYDGYYPQRNSIFIDQLKTAQLYPSVDAPTFNFNSGYVSKTDALEITHENEDGTLYYTINTKAPGKYNDAITGEKYQSSFTINRGSLIKSRYLSAAGEWSPVNEVMLFPEQDFNSLMISEIMYNASLYPEFIELLNAGGEAISLEGLKFTDGIELNFTYDDKIEPLSSMVITGDSLGFITKYQLQAQRQFLKKLKNEGETLLLADYFNSTIDSVSYKPLAPWPEAPISANKSIELKGYALDNALATSWKVSADAGGTPFDVFSVLNYNSIKPLASNVTTPPVTVYPNPVEDGIFTIQSDALSSGAKVSIEIINLKGQVLLAKEVFTYGNIIVNTQGGLPSGIYLLRVKSAPVYATKKLFVE